MAPARVERRTLVVNVNNAQNQNLVVNHEDPKNPVFCWRQAAQALDLSPVYTLQGGPEAMLRAGGDVLHDVQPVADRAVPHPGLRHDALHAVRLAPHLRRHQGAPRHRLWADHRGARLLCRGYMSCSGGSGCGLPSPHSTTAHPKPDSQAPTHLLIIASSAFVLL